MRVRTAFRRPPAPAWISLFSAARCYRRITVMPSRRILAPSKWGVDHRQLGRHARYLFRAFKANPGQRTMVWSLMYLHNCRHSRPVVPAFASAWRRATPLRDALKERRPGSPVAGGIALNAGQVAHPCRRRVSRSLCGLPFSFHPQEWERGSSFSPPRWGLFGAIYIPRPCCSPCCSWPNRCGRLFFKKTEKQKRKRCARALQPLWLLRQPPF